MRKKIAVYGLSDKYESKCLSRLNTPTHTQVQITVQCINKFQAVKLYRTLFDC